MSAGRRLYGFMKEKLDRIVSYATRKGDKYQDPKNPLIIRKKRESE